MLALSHTHIQCIIDAVFSDDDADDAQTWLDMLDICVRSSTGLRSEGGSVLMFGRSVCSVLVDRFGVCGVVLRYLLRWPSERSRAAGLHVCVSACLCVC